MKRGEEAFLRTLSGFARLTGLAALCLLVAAGCSHNKTEVQLAVPEQPPEASAPPREQAASVPQPEVATGSADGTLAPPSSSASPESPLRPGFEVGCQLGMPISGVGVRAWFGECWGAEVGVGAIAVPLQLTARGVWRVLETNQAQLYISPGITWREGFLIPSLAVGTAWSTYGRVSVSLEAGLALTGPGGWLPPGPPLFIGGGASLLGFAELGVWYELP